MAAKSFFNRKWPDKVLEELMNRASVIPDSYQQWTHGRMPWIKLTSNVKVNGDQKLREEHQLFSSKLNTLETSYQLDNRGEPRPGITSLTIKDQGTAGALRKATVSFQVWSLEQLKIYEPLYMTLGTYCVLEWGWSTRSDGTRITEKFSFADMLGSLCDFTEKLKAYQVSSHFNYDGMKGKVTNFGWSLNDNGGFDCEVTLTSMGAVLMSLPLSTSSKSNNCSDSDDANSETGTEEATTFNPNSVGVCKFLYEQQVSGEAFSVPGVEGSDAFVGCPIEFDKDIPEGEEEGEDDDETSYNEDLSYYMTWDYFEEHIINRSLIPEISQEAGSGKGEPCCSGKDADKITDIEGNETAWNKIFQETKANMPHLVERRTVGIGALDSRGTMIRNHPDLISSDPSICVLPGQCHWDGYEEDPDFLSDFQRKQTTKAAAKKRAEDKKETDDRSWIEKKWDAGVAGVKKITADVAGAVGSIVPDDDNVSAKTVQPLNDSGLKFALDGGEDFSYGMLSNILLNVRFIENTLKEEEFIDGFINKILDAVNESCSNMWDLQMIEDPDNSAILRIVDGNLDEEAEDVIVPELPAVGQSSIAREVGIETKLDSKITAMVMYGTNRAKNSHEMGKDGSSKWNLFNAEVVDMDHANMKMRDKVEQDVDGCGNSEEDLIEAALKIKNSYKEARIDLADNVASEQIDAAKTAVRKMVELGAAAEDENGHALSVLSKGITLPLELSITMDGMSGIVWGFPVSIDYLPPRYGGSSFTITGVDHTIDQSGWTVELGTVMRTGAISKTGLEDKTPPQESSIQKSKGKPGGKDEEEGKEDIPEAETEPTTEPQEDPAEEPETAQELADDHFENKHYDVNTMTISQEGIDFIKRKEGFEEKAYQDSVGVWTIGYGTTAAALGRPINPGDTITEEKATQLLQQHLYDSYEPTVKRYVTSEVTQGEFDAMVSWVYNLGSGNFQNSTLLRKFNEGDHEGAAKEFPRWNKAGGKVLAGLTKRRNEEKAMFLDMSIAKA